MSNRRDLHNTLKYTYGASAPEGASDNTALVSAIIDTLGYRATEFLLVIGALVDADADFTVLVEDGDDSGLSDAAAVADNHLLGVESPEGTGAGFVFDDDASLEQIGYIGDKRYVRMTVTPGSNTGAWQCAIAAIQLPELAPATPNV